MGGFGPLGPTGLRARGGELRPAPSGIPESPGAGIPEGPGDRRWTGSEGSADWPRPRTERRGPDKEGLPGSPAPPRARPPSRASWRLRVRRLFVQRSWGPGRPRHPTPGSRERPRESRRPRRAPATVAPAPQRPLQALSLRPTAPPGGGTARRRARPGVLPLPLSPAMAPAA
ncbi:Hypothetical predicted protein [Marmota monax]|uniref:Uncharacterized protein n=1 Tax=Marmota monax TaxID=9995 RepID=A0A5E4AYQ8_MARMO|nr:Hypothetical predicted protein [Marmota monax]